MQYVGLDRIEDWTLFYSELFGFAALPDGDRFGVLPEGRVLRSPCGRIHLQLIEPPVDALDADPGESLQRVAFRTPDVLAAVRTLQQRGVEFVDKGAVASERGAVTRAVLGGVNFELVRDPGAIAAVR